MATTPIRQQTTVRYHGQPVTVIGDLHAGLLAIAGYGTPHEQALAAIDVRLRDRQPTYRVAGSGRWTASLDEVAQAAVTAREAHGERRS